MKPLLQNPMKLKKLPTVHIKNPFSDCPKISTKINKFFLGMKIFIGAILLSSVLGTAFFFNLKMEEKVYREQVILQEKTKASNLENGIVLETTANIIAKEGNIPMEVAKKYAIWIYEAGTKYAVDPLMILSIMSVESRFDYKAISPTGPLGLLQVAATWHKDKVASPAALFDPKTNIHVGTQIVKEYSERSSSDTEMLLRYNGSLGQAPVYAVKVLSKKRTYENKIMDAVVQSI